MHTTREQIQTEIVAERLVLAALNHYQGGDDAAAFDGTAVVFDAIEWDDMPDIIGMLAAMLAEELAARQPVNASHNLAQSIAAKLDFLG